MPHQVVIHFVSSVYDDLPSKVYALVPDIVSHVISVNDQKRDAAVDIAKVSPVVQVAPVQSILFQARGISCVTV